MCLWRNKIGTSTRHKHSKYSRIPISTSHEAAANVVPLSGCNQLTPLNAATAPRHHAVAPPPPSTQSSELQHSQVTSKTQNRVSSPLGPHRHLERRNTLKHYTFHCSCDVITSNICQAGIITKTGMTQWKSIAQSPWLDAHMGRRQATSPPPPRKRRGDG